MKKRINQILELLTKYEKIEVAALAEQLNVSQVTIRKDLDNLEQKGIVKREHGFAILATTAALPIIMKKRPLLPKQRRPSSMTAIRS